LYSNGTGRFIRVEYELIEPDARGASSGTPM